MSLAVHASGLQPCAVRRDVRNALASAVKALHSSTPLENGCARRLASVLCVLGGGLSTMYVGASVEVEAKGDLSRAATAAGAPSGSTAGWVLATLIE